jgi:hypothetical protein
LPEWCGLIRWQRFSSTRPLPTATGRRAAKPNAQYPDRLRAVWKLIQGNKDSLFGWRSNQCFGCLIQIMAAGL